MNLDSNRPIFIEYGTPNMSKPLNFNHLRSFTVGDAYRRLISTIHSSVISDIHLSDIGEQVGCVIYYMKYINPAAQFKTIQDVHKAYISAKHLMSQNQSVREYIICETLNIQNDRIYCKEILSRIFNVFDIYLKIFMSDLNVSVSYFGKESDYLNQVDKFIKEIKNNDLININFNEIVFKKINDLSISPLMLQNGDGRLLYGITDLITCINRYRVHNASKIIYIYGDMLDLHMRQMFDAARQVNVHCDLVHFKLAGYMIDHPVNMRSPELLLHEITTSDCDLTFPDTEHKRRFMVDVFKLENYWKEPNRRVFVSPHKMYKTRGYKVLKEFAHLRHLYAHLIKDGYTSTELTTALRASTDGYTFVPLMNLLRAKMASLREGTDVPVAMNTVMQIMTIFGLGDWDVMQNDHSAPSDETT